MADYFDISQDSPQLKILNMISCIWVFHVVQWTVQKGLLVELDKSPKSVVSLSEKMRINPNILSRIIAGLDHLSIVKIDDNKIEVSELGQLLLPGNENGFYNMANLWGNEFSKAWGKLGESIEIEKPGFDCYFGKNLFSYLADFPEREKVFGLAMSSIAKLLYPEVVKHIQLKASDLVADLGGGNGFLLAEILKQNKTNQGILFDTPQVIEGTKKSGLNSSDRISYLSGDFFKSAPKADTYILSNVIHDWDDDKACLILKNIRRAQTESHRVYIVEMVLGYENEPKLAISTDLNMLMLTGGKERSLAEFKLLLDSSGYDFVGIKNIMDMVCLIEAVPK